MQKHRSNEKERNPKKESWRNARDKKKKKRNSNEECLWWAGSSTQLRISELENISIETSKTNKQNQKKYTTLKMLRKFDPKRTDSEFCTLQNTTE